MNYPYAASQGPFGPDQVRHAARDHPLVDRVHQVFLTACNLAFGGDDKSPDWNEWGVGGPFGYDTESVPVNCPECAAMLYAGYAQRWVTGGT